MAKGLANDRTLCNGTVTMAMYCNCATVTIGKSYPLVLISLAVEVLNSNNTERKLTFILKYTKLNISYYKKKYKHR